LGEEVVNRSQDILINVADLVALCNTSEKPFSHELRLGVIPTIAPYLLPSLLHLMRNEYPDFKLSLKEELSKVLLERLNNGELDVLLLALPYPSQGTTNCHLFYDDFLLAYPDGHPIANIDQLQLSDLDNQDLLLLEDGHCLRDHALEACKLDASELSVPYQATSLNTLVQMVANGMGITLLPKMAIDAHILADIPVTVKPFLEQNVWRAIGLLWRNSSPRKDEFELLGKLLQKLWGDSKQQS
jgi:LysR family hydrogen peroxide-inducible transcriptional activator